MRAERWITDEDVDADEPNPLPAQRDFDDDGCMLDPSSPSTGSPPSGLDLPSDTEGVRAAAFKASVLAARAAELGDDASVLCIDWHGSNSPNKGDDQPGVGWQPAAGRASDSATVASNAA